MKSSYSFEDRGTESTDWTDFRMYSENFRMIYDTPTKAEN